MSVSTFLFTVLISLGPPVFGFIYTRWVIREYIDGEISLRFTIGSGGFYLFARRGEEPLMFYFLFFEQLFVGVSLFCFTGWLVLTKYLPMLLAN